MEDLIQIKPCPFCGGPGRLETRATLAGIDSTYLIKCAICEAQTAPFYSRQAWAVEAWNSRINPAEKTS